MDPDRQVNDETNTKTLYIDIFTDPSARAGYDTRLIF